MWKLIAIAAALRFATAAHAIDVRGRIVDGTAAAVEGARVSLSTASQLPVSAVVSGPDGEFALPAPAPGAYVISATKPGFSESRTAIEISSPVPSSLLLRLDPGPVVSRITVSAETGRALDADRVPQPVTLIPRQSLENRAIVMSDSVEGEPGVHQLRTSPTLGAVFVRGLTGKNVAVFRDGVRYTTSAQRGGISTFLNLVQPSTLDSAEVLRGPDSAQYGSDSLGGTVGLFTRLPDASSWQGEASAMYQSAANAFAPAAGLSRGGSLFSFSSWLGALRSNTLRTGGGIDSHAAVTRFLGLPSTVLGSRLPDTAFTAYGGSLHAQYRPRPLSQLTLHYDRSQQDGGKRYDQLLGGDGNWIADLRNLMLDFGYLRFHRFRAGPFDSVSVTGSYNAQREERVNQGGQGNPLGAITHQYEKTKATGIQVLAGKHLSRIEWIGGGDAYSENMVAPSFAVNPANNAISLVRPRIPGGARYRLWGGFTQASWRPLAGDRLRFSGALRYGGASYGSRASRSPIMAGKPLWPDDSLAARAFSGRFGAVSWLRPSIALHANYSRGFRVPNVTDLGTLGLQGNGQYEAAVTELAGRGALVGDRADDLAKPTGQPVARLRPEVSDNFDGGVRIRRERWQADFAAFRLGLGNTIISQTLLLPQGAVGQPLGEQIISRQLTSGAVFVPTSTSPVLVRSNFSGARLHGIEHSLRVRIRSAWTFSENVTWIRAADSRTGLPPDIEPGVPPLTANPVLTWRPRVHVWIEAYSTLAGRQSRLSSLALSDRRIGNPRSRATIQTFFNNGARTRGLVSNGILQPTGETLAQVQNRVLGAAASAPQFSAIPGYALIGLRCGYGIGERSDVLADFANLADRNYRGIGWGVDGPGRGIVLRIRHRF